MATELGMFVDGRWTVLLGAAPSFGRRSGTASGIGRVGGSAPMESFTELQTVTIA